MNVLERSTIGHELTEKLEAAVLLVLRTRDEVEVRADDSIEQKVSDESENCFIFLVKRLTTENELGSVCTKHRKKHTDGSYPGSSFFASPSLVLKQKESFLVLVR